MRNYYETVMELTESHISSPAWILGYYVQRSGQNHEIVLAKIKQIYIAPYCTSHVILF